MPRGGRQPGAGRPRGTKDPLTKQRETLKKYILARIIREKKPIIDKLLEQAKIGDKDAIRELFDRALGKPAQDYGIDLTSHGREILTIEQINEILTRRAGKNSTGGKI